MPADYSWASRGVREFGYPKSVARTFLVSSHSNLAACVTRAGAHTGAIELKDAAHLQARLSSNCQLSYHVYWRDPVRWKLRRKSMEERMSMVLTALADRKASFVSFMAEEER